MAKDKVIIKDLLLIFGKQKKQAMEMLEHNKSIQEIREETGCAVGVNNVSLTIKEGEMFVIVGLSGSGKSSLIRCINMLNKPTKGEVIVDGENICEYDKSKLREYRRTKAAMVFQHFGLLSHRNVIKNVEYGLEVQGVDPALRRKKAEESINLVGLAGWEKYYPNQLSGGMKQRVGLARALTNEPEILLMDEPFSALDPLIRREMQTELLNLEDYMDKTVIFITHDMNEAFKLGDRIALLRDGEVVQTGKPKDFFNNPADEYVKSFIEDVDKSRIIRVKTVMREPDILPDINAGAKAVLKSLKASGENFCYVVDEQGKLAGYVDVNTLENSGQISIKNLVQTDYESMSRNAFLSEAWRKLSDSDYDVAIVDKTNKLRGVINHEDIVNALA